MADPRHRELLVRSIGLETKTSVVTPGVKPAEPETCVVKGEEMQCVGPIMDSAGRMREAFTDQDGNAQRGQRCIGQISLGEPLTLPCCKRNNT